MRKLFLPILALCLMTAGAAKAQNVSPDFNYGFESDFSNTVPTGWTVIDANNDGVTWFAWTWGEGGGLGHSSDVCVKSVTYNSSFTETYDPDDYLVSPQVTIGEYSTLRFFARAGSSVPEEHFSVEVSTTGNTSASSFTMVQEWTQTGEEDMDIDGWAEYTADLSAYSGQAIYIAIHHSGVSTYDDLRVDDICLINSDGIKDVEASTLSVSPNPATDFIRINGLNANEEVRVYNALGQVVKTARLNDGESLNVSGLAAGVYMLRSEQSGLNARFSVK